MTTKWPLNNNWMTTAWQPNDYWMTTEWQLNDSIKSFALRASLVIWATPVIKSFTSLSLGLPNDNRMITEWPIWVLFQWIYFRMPCWLMLFIALSVNRMRKGLKVDFVNRLFMLCIFYYFDNFVFFDINHKYLNYK